jgi:hypothetical protein
MVFRMIAEDVASATFQSKTEAAVWVGVYLGCMKRNNWWQALSDVFWLSGRRLITHRLCYASR